VRTVNLTQNYKELGPFWNNEWGHLNVDKKYKEGDFYFAEYFSLDSEVNNESYIISGEYVPCSDFETVKLILATGASLHILEKRQKNT
jgi:hypothetical protein